MTKMVQGFFLNFLFVYSFELLLLFLLQDQNVTDDKNLDEQDPYFRIADPDNEHDRYREALERLEKKHRIKVAKVSIKVF